MKLFTKYLWASLLAVVALSSCDDDDPEIPNEEEVITTVILELEDEAGNDIDFVFEDLDGDGGNAPEITSEPLAANTTYHGHIEFLNELAEEEEEEEEEDEDEHGHAHGEDVTEEIREEAEEHQVFYVLSSGVDATAQYEDDDVDADGNPVGLEVIITTGDASTGTLTITLRHEPKKPNDGTLSDAGGETDVEVTFDMVIQ